MPKRRREGDPSTAVAYLRVSTDDQSLGIEAQREAIERWAVAEGVTVVAEHAEQGVSGGAPLDKRPGLLLALDELDDLNAGLLVVAKRDRLARDVMVSAMVERLVQRAGARIVSADGAGNVEGPEGQLMRGMLAVFAQYERALIRGRIRAALAIKKARGERVGQIPFGYQLGEGGVLLEQPEEQVAIARVLELRSDGHSIRGIAAELNTEGVPARGKRWHRTTVERLLKRHAEQGG